MLGNGSSDLSYLKWRRRTWVEIFYLLSLMNTMISKLTLSLHFFNNWLLHWLWILIFLCRPKKMPQRRSEELEALLKLCMVKGWELRLWERDLSGFYAFIAIIRLWHARESWDTESIYLWVHPSCHACEQNRLHHTYRYTHDLHILIGIAAAYRLCNYLRQSRRDGGEYFRDTITTAFTGNLNFTKTLKFTAKTMITTHHR